MDSRDRLRVRVAAQAGIASGFVSALCFAPLDVAKLRLQVQRIPRHGDAPPLYRGIYSTLNVMRRAEGVRALFRGLVPTLLSITPNWFFFFTLYNYAGIRFRQTRHPYLSNFFRDHPVSLRVSQAVFAGGLTNIIMQPLCVGRISLEYFSRSVTGHFPVSQMGSQVASRSPPLRELVKEVYGDYRSMKGFYRGTVSSLLGLLHVVVQFPLYEHFMGQFRPRRKISKMHDVLYCALASSISKFVATVVAYPHEIVRARLQDSPHRIDHVVGSSRSFVRYYSTLDCVRKIWRIEGMKGFYGGLTANLFKTIPNAIVVLVTYEQCRKWLNRKYGLCSTPFCE